MGLLSFIKEAGLKLFGVSDAKAATPEDLQKSVKDIGLNTEGLTITVEGDKVIVSGKVSSTEEAEKLALALGNTAGIATVENNLEVEQATPDATFYTVVKGDTLWKIAETHYGKGKGGQYNVIFEANKPMLSHPDKIYPGQVLRIPPLA